MLLEAEGLGQGQHEEKKDQTGWAILKRIRQLSKWDNMRTTRTLAHLRDLRQLS